MESIISVAIQLYEHSSISHCPILVRTLRSRKYVVSWRRFHWQDLQERQTVHTFLSTASSLGFGVLGVQEIGILTTFHVNSSKPSQDLFRIFAWIAPAATLNFFHDFEALAQGFLALLIFEMSCKDLIVGVDFHPFTRVCAFRIVTVVADDTRVIINHHFAKLFLGVLERLKLVFLDEKLELEKNGHLVAMLLLGSSNRV